MLTARGEEADRILGLELGRRRLRHQAVQPERADGARPRAAAPDGAADRRAGLQYGPIVLDAGATPCRFDGEHGAPDGQGVPAAPVSDAAPRPRRSSRDRCSPTSGATSIRAKHEPSTCTSGGCERRCPYLGEALVTVQQFGYKLLEPARRTKYRGDTDLGVPASAPFASHTVASPCGATAALTLLARLTLARHGRLARGHRPSALLVAWRLATRRSSRPRSGRSSDARPGSYALGRSAPAGPTPTARTRSGGPCASWTTPCRSNGDGSTDLARHRARMDAILAEMAEGVLVVDRHGRVQLVNEAARRLLPARGTPGDPYIETVRHPGIVAELARGARGRAARPDRGDRSSDGRDEPAVHATPASEAAGRRRRARAARHHRPAHRRPHPARFRRERLARAADAAHRRARATSRRSRTRRSTPTSGSGFSASSPRHTGRMERLVAISCGSPASKRARRLLDRRRGRRRGDLSGRHGRAGRRAGSAPPDGGRARRQPRRADRLAIRPSCTTRCGTCWKTP